MDHRKVDDIDAYGFPERLYGYPMLAWMGPDYVDYVTRALLAVFRRQDEGTEMLGIRCEGEPSLTTRARADGTIVGVVLELPLQVLLKDSSGGGWRLKGKGTFEGHDLTVPGKAGGRTSFALEATESVDAA